MITLAASLAEIKALRLEGEVLLDRHEREFADMTRRQAAELRAHCREIEAAAGAIVSAPP